MDDCICHVGGYCDHIKANVSKEIKFRCSTSPTFRDYMHRRRFLKRPIVARILDPCLHRSSLPIVRTCCAKRDIWGCELGVIGEKTQEAGKVQVADCQRCGRYE